MSDAKFADHFSSVANRYAEFRPQYPAALFDYLATLVPPDSLVWDCACGTGQASVDLAKRFARVVATDASREQIAAATEHPSVEYRVAPAEASTLADQSVGLITVAQALHWFDLDRFVTEVRRVLVPGGVLAVWTYGVNEVADGANAPAINRAINRYYSETVGPYWPKERRLVEEGYRTIALPFGYLPAPELQLETQWTLDELIGYFSTWSATNRYIKATGENPMPAVTRELAALWRETHVPRRIVWPLTVRVTRR